MKIINTLSYTIIFVSILTTCSGRVSTKESNDILEEEVPLNLSEVNIFIENSASTFGYTSTNSSYINVVNDLAQFSNIVSQTEAEFNYYLISGSNQNLTEYELGNDPSILSSTLSPSGLRRPTSTNSDINGMFNHVLKALKENSISILISDGIYDIGEESNPLAALETQGIGTRTTFIQNLKQDNTETLVIKLNSEFEGYYYYGAKIGQEKIKQNRPYYIWVFGDAELVDEFFSDGRIKNLNGYLNHTAFKKLGISEVNYNTFSMGNSNVRKSRESNTFEVSRVGNAVEFTIAAEVDFIRLGEAYLNEPSNYNINLGYKLKEAIRVDKYPDDDGKVKRALESLKFEPSHFLIFSSENPNLGQVNISLEPRLPNWIIESTSNTDSPLNGDELRTFGLGTLVNGINEAYMEVSNAKEIFNLTINIQD